MMSEATEFAIYKLGRGDRTAAEKRLAELSKTKQVKEHAALTEALEAKPVAGSGD